VAYTGNRLPSVCVVTSEIVGPPGSGGIGTAMTGLAEHLATSGCRVTILYTGSIAAPDFPLAKWKAPYAERGIELVALAIKDLKSLAGPVRDHGFGTPCLVYQFLTSRHFDVVHFNDYGGEGSLCLAARKLGLAFRDTLLVVAMHGPSEWALELNQARPITLVQCAHSYAERLSVKCADVLWSPSHYLLDWTRQNGFAFPPQVLVQQYCLPSLPAASAPRGRAERVKDIVFFGRLEARKGLPLFCDSIEQLDRTLVDGQVSVTFLGKPGLCEGMDGLAYVAWRAKAWRCAVKAVTHLGQADAIAYLRSGGKLAVMASPADNSPCTVYEALSWGIPFLAANVGGVPELVHPDDHSRVLFDSTTDGLSASLRGALDQGGWVAAPAVPQEDTRRHWSDFHANWHRHLTPVASPVPPGRVVAIVDGTSAAGIQRTLESLAVLDAVHRVIVLTGAGAAATSTTRSFSVCNIGLSQSDTRVLDDELAAIADKTVLLICAGIAIHAGAFTQMLSALTTADMDGLQPAGEVPSGRARRIIVPLGGDPVFTLFEGATFTGGLLVRGSAFARMLRGRAYYSDLIATEGLEIWPYPQPVFEGSARWAPAPVTSLPSRVRALAGGSEANRRLAAKVRGVADTDHRPRRGRVVWALWLIDLGLAPLVRVAASTRRRLRAVRSRRWLNRLDG